jgi:regulation of enolase protein 1 (concanavalin A-like superfamily)
MSSKNNLMLLYEKIIEYSTKFWEQVFLGFQRENHLFQRTSGCSHFCSSILCLSRDLMVMDPCISTKKFWEQVFLGFQRKNHLFQRKSGNCYFAQVFPACHVTAAEKVLGTSFSWISGKKSLVPT